MPVSVTIFGMTRTSQTIKHPGAMSATNRRDRQHVTRAARGSSCAQSGLLWPCGWRTALCVELDTLNGCAICTATHTLNCPQLRHATIDASITMQVIRDMCATAA